MTTTTGLDLTGLDTDGPVFLPDDPGYQAECATFNPYGPLRPAAVIAAAGTGDVQAVVRFAAAAGLPVAIRGGGHLQPRDAAGGLLLTLDRMRSVTIDPGWSEARITGTPRWREVLEAAAVHGLAPPNGSSVDVGAVGYLLGGGHSPVLGRAYGHASDQVSEIEVVTADGELRTVTADNDAELFFALRGSKGNLGVVTAITFGLFPIDAIVGGGLWFAGERLAEILPAWRDWAATLPESASTSVAIQRLPPLPQLPQPLRGAFVVHVRFSSLDVIGGEALIAPMRALGATIMDSVARMPFAANGTIHNDPPVPMPAVERLICLRELPDEALAVVNAMVGPDVSDCPVAAVEIRALGGALDRSPAAPDAVPSRGVPYSFLAVGLARTSPEVARLHAYVHELTGRLAPWEHDRRPATFIGPGEGMTPADLSKIYGPDLYDRIVAVKQKYDPANMFRFNHNITAR